MSEGKPSETSEQKKTSSLIPSWIPSWQVLLGTTLLLFFAFVLGRLGFDFLVLPYQEMNYSGLIHVASLVEAEGVGCPRTDPGCKSVWASVNYPKMLSRADQGCQPGKRLVVNLWLDSGPDTQVMFAVVPRAKTVRLLDEKEHIISGFAQITVTRSINTPITFYLEHTQVKSSLPPLFSLDLLPPTLGMIQPHSLAPVFEIRQEPQWHRWARETVQATLPITNLGVVLLGALATFLKWVLERAVSRMDEIAKLAVSVEDAERENNNQEVKKGIQDYDRLRWLWVRNRYIEEVAEKIEKKKKRKEAKKLLIQALEALERYAVEKAKGHLEQIESLSCDFEAWFLGKITSSLFPDGAMLEAKVQVSLSDTELGDLIKVLEDQSHAPVVRKWVVRLLARCPDPKSVKAVNDARRNDLAVEVRAEAMWRDQYAERDASMSLRPVPEGIVQAWLSRLPLKYNPFQFAKAEDERGRGEDWPVYPHPDCERLWDARHIVLFADDGGGKTTFCLKLNVGCQNSPILAVEYTDFVRWISAQVAPVVDVHIDNIVRLVVHQLGHIPDTLASVTLPNAVRLGRLVAFAQEKGYRSGIWILVDDVKVLSTKSGLDAAEQAVRHLVDTLDILDVPYLGFKFFLPSILSTRLEKYRGLSEGWIERVDLRWEEDHLLGLLNQRLVAAMPRDERPQQDVEQDRQASRSDSFPLDRLVKRGERGLGVLENLSKSVVKEAKGSPRRLVRLINRLFQIRAYQWNDGGRQEQDRWFRSIDWAYLVEWLIKEQPLEEKVQAN